jgi:hypothetical protein
MRGLGIGGLALIVAIHTFAADDFSKYQYWITGEVFEQHGELMFRCDKPVKDNPAGRVVYLGADRAGMKVILPLLMKAAEQHQKLRLYGILAPVDEKTRTVRNSPSAQFIVWKLHLPDEPDELPANQKIMIGPNDRVKGYRVEEIKEKP